MSTLPKNTERKPIRTVRDMRIGETAYVTHDAVWVNNDRKIWITFNSTLHRKTIFDYLLKIKRTEKGVQISERSITNFGYRVYNFEWTTSSSYPVELK